MPETHIVFNDQISLYSQRYISKTAPIPEGFEKSSEIQKEKILALLFEQFLLFDKIAIKIDHQNLELYFLIKELGINKVEELLDNRVLIPVLWTPLIVTGLGMRRDDGTTDESSIIGQPPIIAGALSGDVANPEYIIDKVLSYFNLHKDRKRIFKRKVVGKIILPDNKIANKSAEIVIDAYIKGKLVNLGLEPIKEPTKLNREERDKLFQLGNHVLETTVLAEKGYKSYDKLPDFTLTKDSIRSIESAYHVSENTSTILKIENLANIQDYVLTNKIPFERVFDLRYKKNIKEYRKWINTLSVDTDTKEITKEYLDEVEGKNKFFESTGGKFIRNVAMLGIGTGLGAALAGIGGAAAGMIAGSKATELGLSLFDSYVIDGILRGWNPRMFVDEIKYEVTEEATLYSKQP